MSQFRRPSSSWLRHRTAAAATAVALIGGTVAAGAAPAQARIWTPFPTGTPATAPATSSVTLPNGTVVDSGPSTVWAMTVTGHKVLVHKPTFTATPDHPEKLTHPGRDFAGSTVAAHFKMAAINAAKRYNTVPQLPGIDVSSYQGNINWSAIARYLDFSYTKATEGTYYTNPDFYNQYEGPYNAGLIRGSYHFAIPNNSSGATQANYFLAHGGGWSGDGKTLPGALDIEYNPYGSECYGLTQSQMVSWIWSFVNQYAYRERVYPVIYTTTDWWSTCTGNNGGFGSRDPLWIANYSASHGGTLPNGWGFYTFWQYRDNGSLPGDQDVFNGAHTQLQVLSDRG